MVDVRPLALDLAGTFLARGSGRERDVLGSPADLGRWLEGQRHRIGEPGPETALRLADFRALRAAIRSLLAAVAAGEPAPPGAVEAVNAASGAVPIRRMLDASDPRRPVAAEAAAGGSRTLELLAAIARSAIEVVGGPDRGRVRVCGAPGCGTFFLAGRAGQVWCSAACGNRARVARHHDRRRASP